MPVQMFSQRVLLFIFPLLINWAIIAANRDFHESSLERKMENMAEVVKEMKGVSAESSMRINDHFEKLGHYINREVAAIRKEAPHVAILFN